MIPEPCNKRILLIDRQPYWREISTKGLQRAGFSVGTLDTYTYQPPQLCLEDGDPDLVVLGCTRIQAEEQQLIDKVLAQRHHLLVLCTSLSWQTMRVLFRQGVADILEKPYNPAKLVNIVSQVLEHTSSYINPPRIEVKGAA
jgi:DNA-binding NtrC family response regulator